MKKPPFLNIALAGDANYFIGLETTFASAIAASHQQTKTFNFYIDGIDLTEEQRLLLDDLSQKLARKYQITIHIHWLAICHSILEKLKPIKDSRAYYTRLLLPELVPDQDWIVWIDSDIVVRKDMSGIETFLDDSSLMTAVNDHSIPTIGDEEADVNMLNSHGLDLSTPYYNTGFFCMNMKMWRDLGITEKLLTWLYEYQSATEYHDQSAINWCLADQITPMPEDYNSMATKAYLGLEDFTNPVNLHFAGVCNPWQARVHWTLKFIEQDLRYFFSCYEFYLIRNEIMYRCDTELLKNFLSIAKSGRELLSCRLTKASCSIKVLYHQTIGKKHRVDRWKKRRDFYRNEVPVLLKKVDLIISQTEQFIANCSAKS